MPSSLPLSPSLVADWMIEWFKQRKINAPLIRDIDRWNHSFNSEFFSWSMNNFRHHSKNLTWICLVILLLFHLFYTLKNADMNNMYINEVSMITATENDEDITEMPKISFFFSSFTFCSRLINTFKFMWYYLCRHRCS